MSANKCGARHRERQFERLPKPGRRPAAVSLATVLAQHPGSFDGRKISAVDKRITLLDVLPDRYAAVKTLYVSKNNLRSLAGIEQFRGLRALSVADNSLADLGCLHLLPAAAISLEAASFEGNPMADLPNYRAHVITTLGPSLTMLDNRAVTEEERRAAPCAVAHEATMLALMTSNACLVHKLGRAVQLINLHCELQCAVLGGQYGTLAAAGTEGLPGISGQGISRVLQLWDYEGSLGSQERHAVGLAIRREVVRLYRKLVLAGGKAEGSIKLWQQAFAQVMLLQQETIASLMGMLEAAKAEAAATLAPITRPLSPSKLQALEGQREAQGRVQQDREALIQELRDALLGLAEAAAHSNVSQRATEYEGRIRELHAALEAAVGGGGGPPLQTIKGQAEERPAAAEAQWAIPAMRPASAGTGETLGAVQGQAGATGLKNALKQQHPEPTRQGPALRPSAMQPGGSHTTAGSQPTIPRTGTVPPTMQQLPAAANQWGQEEEEQRQRRWQPDDGLAEYEQMEQARSKTPRPLQAGSSEQWVPNPLACHGDAGGSSGLFAAQNLPQCPSPPGGDNTQQGYGLQSIIQLLQQEGRVDQIQALQSVMQQHETAAAELQAANHQLAVALADVQGHSHKLEAQLIEQRAALEEAQSAAAALEQQQAQQLEALGERLKEALASRAALKAEVEAAAAQQQVVEQAQAERQELVEQARAECEMAAVKAQQLQARVAELEGRKAVELRLTIVSHEDEWRAEAVRAAAQEARTCELVSQVAGYQRRERLEAACSALASRAILRRALMRWQEASGECAYLAFMERQAGLLHRRSLGVEWLRHWRLATQRSRLLAARKRRWQLGCLQLGWQAWRAFCQEGVLHRGLLAAAGMHHQSMMLRRYFGAWVQYTAACQQVELPPQHPTLRAAVALQRRRLLRDFFGSWRQYMQEHVLPCMAQVQMRLLEQWMGSQRRAFLAWQGYLQCRTHTRMLKALAAQHHMRHLLSHWRQAAQEARQDRNAVLRCTIVSKAMLLRRGWRAWRQGAEEKRLHAQQKQLAQQHCRHNLLSACWHGWQQWTQVCRGINQRRDRHLLGTGFKAWRAAVKVAEKRRLAVAFHQHCSHRRFRSSLHAWRAVVAFRRQRQHQLAHARTLLRRRLLSCIMAGWRRAALAGKLAATLGVVAQLQDAVERVREELQSKSEQLDALQSVRVEVEGQAECLSVQVNSLDADLAAAQHQAAELQAAVHAAQERHQEAAESLKHALASQSAAEADRVAAVAQRDAAVAVREKVEREREAACAARAEAELAAADAAAKAQGAADAAAAAITQAAAASAALDQLLQEHHQAKKQLAQVQEERQALAAQLQEAWGEIRCTTERLQRLQQECDNQRRAREQAECSCTAAVAEQQAALKQAERLAAMCEEQEQQCGQLQQQVAQLQAMLGGQSSLQEELAALMNRNHQLHMEQQQLQAHAQEAEVEAKQLAKLVDSLQGTKTTLQGQLAEAQAEAAQQAAACQSAAVAADALRAERDGLAATVQQLQEVNAGLEAAVSRLREHLQQSNAVLDSCRQMLGECCSARAAVDNQAVSLTELLRAVQADQLLKEASIKALTRENAQRGDRLRALQAQVDALSQQVHTSQASQVSRSGPAGSCLQGATKLEMYSHLAPAAFAPSAPASCGSSCASGRASPAAATAPVAGMLGGPMLARPASSGSPGTTSAPHTWHQGAVIAGQACSFQPLAASSCMPPFIPLSTQHQAHASSSKSHAGGSAGHADFGHSGAVISQPLPPPVALSPGALSPAEAPALLPPEMSDQRLSYLLEMVVNKRISATQAQQAINAAADGDARPLLQVLDTVKRLEGRSPVLATCAASCVRLDSSQTPPSAGSSGPVLQSELAAVRRQLQRHIAAARAAVFPS